MKYSNMNVLIIGMARSGIAAAERLRELGADVTLVDQSTSNELKRRSLELEKKRIRTRLGPHLVSDLELKDLVVVSPAIPSSNVMIREAKNRNIPVWSEIELGYRMVRTPIIGITGTNGKTTTTSIVRDIFEEAGRKGIIAGNYGFPLVNFYNEDPSSMLIVELSSFQLENIVSFRPFISVLLNITEDHLDWHPDFADYVRAKSRLFMNQTAEDYAIINQDDPVVAELADSIKANVLPFSKCERLDKGLFIANGKIIAVLDQWQEVCSIDALRIRGEHNLDNVMAATAASLIAGITIEDIRNALTKFNGIAHRLEFVASIDGVDYFNDSKATNPDAALKALGAFNSPVVFMAGGKNKGNSFKSLAQEIKKRAKAIVLFGEAASEIYPLVSDSGLVVIRAETVPEAVLEARSLSQAGDVVLFSPACASFDQFSGYEERGRVFKEAVANL